MTRLAHGSRTPDGRWVPDDPSAYPAMDVHGILPWTVLRQDSAPWQTRKATWKETGLGIHDRPHAAGMMRTGRHGAISGGVSVFDPVLAELAITWYCPPSGHVLDPCGGGPERGSVATALGRDYTAIEPSPPPNPPGTWITGYAQDELPALGQDYDYVLACPPYHNRETYSDDPRDLSAMTWTDYIHTLRHIVAETTRCLRPDRFATWIVSDVRDHRGHLRGLPQATWQAIVDAGMHVTAEQILISPVGTAHKRMRVPWEACRTPTRTHQHVITAVKGDRRSATKAITC